MDKIKCDKCGGLNVKVIFLKLVEKVLTMDEWFKRNQSVQLVHPILIYKKVTLKCPDCGYEKEGTI